MFISKNRIFLISLVSVFLTFMTSCATVFTGTYDTVYINSKPEGAKILIDGNDYGRTPRDIRISRCINSKYVRLEKEGYKTRYFKLLQEFNMTTIANIFMPWGFAVDAISGAMFIYNPNYYEIELEAEK